MSHGNLEIRDITNTFFFFYKYCVHDSVLLFIYAYSYVGFKSSLELVL